MIWLSILVAVSFVVFACDWLLRRSARQERAGPASAQLRPPGHYDSFPSYLLETSRNRSFAVALATTRLSGEFSDSYLGRIWLILEPLLMAGIYALVFGFGLRAGEGIDHFIVWLLIGQTFFRFSQRAVQSGSTSLRKNGKLLSTYSFPRLVLPAADVIKAMLQFFPGLATVGVAMLGFGVPISAKMFMLPVIFGGFTAFCLGCAALAARVSFWVPDITKLIDLVFRLLFFASCVFIPASILLGRGRAGQLMFDLLPLNPFYSFLQLGRWSLLSFDSGHLTETAISAVAWTAIAVAGGTWLFFRGEGSYGPARNRRLGR